MDRLASKAVPIQYEPEMWDLINERDLHITVAHSVLKMLLHHFDDAGNPTMDCFLMASVAGAALTNLESAERIGGEMVHDGTLSTVRVCEISEYDSLALYDDGTIEHRVRLQRPAGATPVPESRIRHWTGILQAADEESVA